MLDCAYDRRVAGEKRIQEPERTVRVRQHANGPHQPVGEAPGVAVADHATARHRRKAADMDEDEKAAIDEIANSLQVINL